MRSSVSSTFTSFRARRTDELRCTARASAASSAPSGSRRVPQKVEGEPLGGADRRAAVVLGHDARRSAGPRAIQVDSREIAHVVCAEGVDPNISRSRYPVISRRRLRLDEAPVTKALLGPA